VVAAPHDARCEQRGARSGSADCGPSSPCCSDCRKRRDGGTCGTSQSRSCWQTSDNRPGAICSASLTSRVYRGKCDCISAFAHPPQRIRWRPIPPQSANRRVRGATDRRFAVVPVGVVIAYQGAGSAATFRAPIFSSRSGRVSMLRELPAADRHYCRRAIRLRLRGANSAHEDQRGDRTRCAPSALGRKNAGAAKILAFVASALRC